MHFPQAGGGGGGSSNAAGVAGISGHNVTSNSASAPNVNIAAKLPPVCSEPKVFMGQVPTEATQQDVHALMSRYGTINKCTLITLPDGRSKGCAMVLFQKWGDAELAIEHENGTTNLGGTKPLVVRFADPPKRSGEGPVIGIVPKKLFVGQVPAGISDETLRALFAPHGNIVELHVLHKPAGAGCAFVTYERWSQAEAAMEAINGRTQLDGAKSPIVVKFADAKIMGNGMGVGMGRANNLGMGVGGFNGNLDGSFGIKRAYGLGGDMSGGFGAPSKKMAAAMSPYGMGFDGHGGGMSMGMATGFGGMGAMMGNMGVGGGMAMALASGGAMGMAAGRPRGALDEAKEWKLFIGQVPFEAKEMDLWPIFAQAGTILELVILRSQGKSKGCAFVTYENRMMAERAIRSIDGQVCTRAGCTVASLRRRRCACWFTSMQTCNPPSAALE